MFALVLAASSAAVGVTGDFSSYAGFTRPTPAYGVEAVVGRGPIAEVIVRCPRGTAIVSFSKIENVFCTPKDGCHRNLHPAAMLACGR